MSGWVDAALFPGTPNITHLLWPSTTVVVFFFFFYMFLNRCPQSELQLHHDSTTDTFSNQPHFVEPRPPRPPSHTAIIFPFHFCKQHKKTGPIQFYTLAPHSGAGCNASLCNKWFFFFFFFKDTMEVKWCPRRNCTISTENAKGMLGVKKIG